MDVLYIITELIGFVMLGLGYLIRFRGRVELIAGYDEKRVRDPEGLARFVGTNLLLLGAGAFAVLALEFLIPGYAVLFFVIYALVAVPLVSFITVRGSSRYEKRDS
ncbi:DUF3784 domain-containing protein [Methanoculleus taiwanensis]|nr:DUF3784 domain-containing protein [Methanoculleus taiwanensis]